MRGFGGSTLRGGQTVFHSIRMWGQLFQAAMLFAAFMTVAVPAWNARRRRRSSPRRGNSGARWGCVLRTGGSTRRGAVTVTGWCQLRVARLFVEEVRFEWVPPGALLGELEGDRPEGDEPATAVDVVLWSRLGDGRRGAVLIKVKLSEDRFTTCNGRLSSGNRRRDVCDSASLFLGDPSSCYLRRPRGKRRDRRYWEIFAESHGSVGNAFPGAGLDGPCPFAGNAQQPMRNLAIARALEQEGMVDEAWFVLCVHDDNLDVPGHWKAWAELLPDREMAPSLPASKVIDAGEAEGYGAWAAWMRDRYRLGEAQRSK